MNEYTDSTSVIFGKDFITLLVNVAVLSDHCVKFEFKKSFGIKQTLGVVSDCRRRLAGWLTGL